MILASALDYNAFLLTFLSFILPAGLELRPVNPEVEKRKRSRGQFALEAKVNGQELETHVDSSPNFSNH